MSRLLPCLFALYFAAPLGAESPHRPPPGPPFFQLAEVLHLSDAQLAPVRTILRTQHEQIHALNQANRTQRQQLRDSMHDKLRTILNAKQMQKLSEFEQTHRPPPPENDKHARPHHGYRTPPSR